MELKLTSYLHRFLFLLVTFCTCNLSFATSSSLDISTDCEKFNQASTVILACARWNSWCLSFIPIFESLSNEPQNNNWTFYKMDTSQAPDFYCGKKTDNSIVTLFVKNAKNNDVNTDAIMKESNYSFIKNRLMALLAEANKNDV